ncbi:MAG: ABC transporter family substrate-binding protein [Frankiaceae bacterium]
MQELRKRAAVLAPVAVLALGAAACGGGSNSSQSGGGAPTTKQSVRPSQSVGTGGSLTFAYAQACPGFNVNQANDALAICALIMSPAVLPTTFDVYPDYSLHANKGLLVKEPTVSISTGKQVVTYDLNPNAKWSDGPAIGAADFKYMFDACNGKDTKYNCAGTTGYDHITSVKQGKDAHQVVVTFAKPFADWRSLFSALLPAHVFASGGPQAFNNKLEGNPPSWTGGPFKITGFQKDQSVTLTRWDGYAGPKAHLDTVTFRFLAEETGEPQALQNGEVDLIYPQPQLDIIQQVKAIPNITATTSLGADFEHFDFNQKNPLLAQKPVRLAIAQALNRTQLLDATVKQFTNQAQVLNNHIFMPGQSGYQDNSGGLGSGNIPQAQQTLQAAGWTKQGQWYAKNGQTLALDISTTAGNALRQNQETIFKQQMEQLGIKINIKNYPADKFFSDIVPNEKYDIADFAWVGTPFPVSSNVAIYQTGGGENWTAYSNKQVDQWLQEAIGQTDPRKAIDLMNKVDKQLWTDVNTVTLYQKPIYLAYRNKYANIQDNPTSAGPVWNIWSWGVKTQ